MMQSLRLSGAARGCSDSSAPSTVVAAAGKNGLGIRSVTWHSSVPPEKEPPSRRRNITSPPLATIEEPSPHDQQKRWLEQEVERLTDKSQGLEEQLLVAQSAAMAMASRIEQLEELVKVVGTGAAAALDAQCSYLQQEISQQDTALAEKQDSLAMLEELHARAMQRKETQVRGLQRKLFDATTQLRAQEQAMQMREERFAKLRTVYTENQKLKARILKLTEEAEARETQLQELRDLVDVKVDRAAASMAAEEETCELYEGLAGELVGFAAHARAARQLLQRAHMKCPARELPSPLWQAGFVECMQLHNRMCVINNTNAAATDDETTSSQTWTPLATIAGGTSSMCYSPRSFGDSTAYASTGPSSAGGTSFSSNSPRGLGAGGTPVAAAAAAAAAAGADGASTTVYSTLHRAAAHRKEAVTATDSTAAQSTAPHSPTLRIAQNSTAAVAGNNCSPNQSKQPQARHTRGTTVETEVEAPPLPPPPAAAAAAAGIEHPVVLDNSTRQDPVTSESGTTECWALLGSSEVESNDNSKAGYPPPPPAAAAAASVVASVAAHANDSFTGDAAIVPAVNNAAGPAAEATATAAATAAIADGPLETQHSSECTEEEESGSDTGTDYEDAELAATNFFLTAAAEFSVTSLSSSAAAAVARRSMCSDTASPVQRSAGDMAAVDGAVPQAAVAAVAAMAAVEQAFSTAVVQEVVKSWVDECSGWSEIVSAAPAIAGNTAAEGMNPDSKSGAVAAAAEGAVKPAAARNSSSSSSSRTTEATIDDCGINGDVSDAGLALIVPKVSSLIKVLESKAAAAAAAAPGSVNGRSSPNPGSPMWQRRPGAAAAAATAGATASAAVAAWGEGSSVGVRQWGSPLLL